MTGAAKQPVITLPTSLYRANHDAMPSEQLHTPAANP